MKSFNIGLIITIYLCCNLVYSQNNSKSPQLSLSDGFLDYYNFPGISENGRYIALIRNDYSCCIETDLVFEIHDTKTKAIVTSILLYASPDQRSSKTFTEQKQKRNFDQAKKFLNKREYVPMKIITNYKKKKEKNNLSTQLEIPYKEKLLKSQRFKLPVFYLHPYCCTADLESDEPCNPSGTINNLYLDKKLRYLLIESGIHHPADGCDMGPEFLIVWLFK